MEFVRFDIMKEYLISIFDASESFAYPAGMVFAAACIAFFALLMINRRQSSRGTTRTTGVVCALLALLVAACVVVFPLTRSNAPVPDLYRAAVSDAVFADADEIRSLVTLTKDDDRITWNERGEKVLLLSWNNTPEAYLSGSSVVVSDYDIWAFADGEMIRWYRENANGVTDWTARLERLLGLPEGFGYTHVSAFWCEPAKLIRPAYVTDVSRQVTPESLDCSQLGEWAKWFNDNTLYSYFSEQFPWTRLGYTYDWAEGGEEYGLTEFLIPQGVEVDIMWTKTTDEFIAWLQNS